MKKLRVRFVPLLMFLAMMINLMYVSTPVYANPTDVSAFPESYQPYINALISEHPNWIFVPYNTNIDFYELVSFQSEKDRSLIEKSSNPEYYFSKKEGDYDPVTGTYIGKSGSNWVAANEATIAHYIDPRNFLNSTDAFMFLKLEYNEGIHTTENIEILLEKSWMHNRMLEDTQEMSYAQAFAQIGQELGISSFFLASRVALEQGSGTSPLISGNYTGFEGYYNYFNIGAAGSSTTAVIVNGLKHAKNKDWDTRYKSLYGGAENISKQFINKKQDTLYFQKFDVVNGIASHQYMQNIQAPVTEGWSMRATYRKVGLLNEEYVFSVPVYNNMPNYACQLPRESTGITPPTAGVSAGNVDAVSGTMTINISNITSGSGVANIEVRAYTMENMADDLIYYSVIQNTDGTYTATIDIAKHNKARGEYCIEVYITDNMGIEEYVGSVNMTMPDMAKPQLFVRQMDGVLTFVLKNASAYLGVEHVYFPTWSQENGQDDLVWYRGFNEDGLYKAEILIENHPTNDGLLNVHVYITDGTGEQTGVLTKVIELRDFNLIYGDVNFDSIINAQDALIVLKGACKLQELTYDEKDAADVNYDYIYNAQDALLILQHAAGIKEIEEFTW